MRLRSRIHGGGDCRAFTLVEVVMAAGLAAIVGIAGYMLLNSGLVLYAKNFSINNSHYTARMSLEKMIMKINSSGAAPILVDETGADIPGDGPAAGVRLCTLPANSAYKTFAGVSATATSLKVKIEAGQLQPRESDILIIDAGSVVQTGTVVQCEIASVIRSGDVATLNLRTPVGSDVTANNMCLVLQQIGFIAVGDELRHYPKVMSVARHGAAAFNSRTNYDLLSGLQPATGTQALPFSYNDPARIMLSVDIRSRVPRYTGSTESFNNYFNIKSAVAVKAIYLDPTKLETID